MLGAIISIMFLKLLMRPIKQTEKEKKEEAAPRFTNAMSKSTLRSMKTGNSRSSAKGILQKSSNLEVLDEMDEECSYDSSEDIVNKTGTRDLSFNHKIQTNSFRTSVTKEYNDSESDIDNSVRRSFARSSFKEDYGSVEKPMLR